MQEEPKLSERDQLENQIARLSEAIDAVSSAPDDSPIFDWLEQMESIVEECEEILRSDDETESDIINNDAFDSLGIEAESLSDVLNEGEEILEEAMDDDGVTEPIPAKSRKQFSSEVEAVKTQAWLLYHLLIRAT